MTNNLRPILFLVVAIGLELFIFFMPREIMYSDMEWIRWICMLGVIFVQIPLCLFNVLRTFSGSWAKGISMLSILINGPTFGIYHQIREFKELRNDGLWTTGIVIDKKYINKRGPDYWAVKLEYSVDSVRYITSWTEDEKNKIEKGETLDIIYLDGFPKIYRVNTNAKTRENYFD